MRADRTLWRDNDGRYISRCVDNFSLSPIYVVASAARRLIREGVQVDLPDGYTADVLAEIVWLTGVYGQPVTVTERQAQEIAEIARTLMDHHADRIGPRAHEGIRQIIKIVTTEEARQHEDPAP